MLVDASDTPGKCDPSCSTSIPRHSIRPRAREAVDKVRESAGLDLSAFSCRDGVEVAAGCAIPQKQACAGVNADAVATADTVADAVAVAVVDVDVGVGFAASRLGVVPYVQPTTIQAMISRDCVVTTRRRGGDSAP